MESCSSNELSKKMGIGSSSAATPDTSLWTCRTAQSAWGAGIDGKDAVIRDQPESKGAMTMFLKLAGLMLAACIAAPIAAQDFGAPDVQNLTVWVGLGLDVTWTEQPGALTELRYRCGPAYGWGNFRWSTRLHEGSSVDGANRSDFCSLAGVALENIEFPSAPHQVGADRTMVCHGAPSMGTFHRACQSHSAHRPGCRMGNRSAGREQLLSITS